MTTYRRFALVMIMLWATAACAPATSAVPAGPGTSLSVAVTPPTSSSGFAISHPPAAGSSTPGAHCTVVDGRADARCTPGAFNPDVTQATIGTTICRKKWTRTVRPSTPYTNGLKRTQKIEYGEADVPDADLEEDHLVPLELGGAPRDPKNLWPEPRAGLHPSGEKDPAEHSLRADVCAGRMTLAAARQKIVTDWTHPS